jgi:hypothetical protein
LLVDLHPEHLSFPSVATPLLNLETTKNHIVPIVSFLKLHSTF